MSLLAGIPLINGLVKTVFGDKDKREQYSAQANSATTEQYAAEFRENRNWFDSLVDGVNRLPRPMIVFGVIYLFALCWNNPERFAEGAQNLDLIPPEMWAIFGVVITFYFGDRTLKHLGNRKHHREAIARLHEHKKKDAGLGEVHIVKSSNDPQEGVAWNDRVEKRYSGLND